ncbi:MAG: DUF4102 domain-containing protein [Gammaproteobacteria bacterium]|nr:DUF4102 domain-containing protein [Gammaproteobacteria bacterium]
MSKTLTVARAKAVTQPGMYGDGGTLYLKVAPGGSKSWIQRLTIDGRRHDIGLGAFPLVTLARARELAFDNRRDARAGGDPLAAKRRAKMPTFRDAAEKTFAANRQRWRNGKHTTALCQRCRQSRRISGPCRTGRSPMRWRRWEGRRGLRSSSCASGSLC